ncbi:hypothetical protein G7Z17_g10437 [Cylindrodendrum hubeiense]|uniref:ethanolamine kinase n=1 Tax=Cylindrodendrum hubeiense TaxID=595255 RepID=A0A9P5H754_9HYPO|nr:hypothetical protein G7Z17_g10437 [Cylindrodendrum hubeiense]
MTVEIPFVPHVFDESEASGSIHPLASFLFPDRGAGNGEIEVTRLTQGTTNALFKASHQRPDQASKSAEEIVLVKVYGEGTEVTIDRNKEIKLHKILSDNKLAPSVLVRFSNGHGYQFLDGTPCSVEAIVEEKIWRGVARELARWHAVLPNAPADGPDVILKFEPSVWSTAKKWLDALPSETEHQRAQKSQLEAEFDYLIEHLLRNRPQDPLVFGHGDLLCGNIIIQEEAAEGTPASVRFIDYEHSTYCPRAFELANHFAEWTGFECNYNLLPTRSTRREFIREYLQTHHNINNGQDGTASSHASQVAEAEVNQVMADVDLFRGFPGFYWGLCALIQAQASTGSIDFDYAGYAEKRLSEYWAWRRSGGPDTQTTEPNQAVSQREARWAAP